MDLTKQRERDSASLSKLLGEPKDTDLELAAIPEHPFLLDQVFHYFTKLTPWTE